MTKKTYAGWYKNKETKENGMKFNEFSIGDLLLGNFADAYAERRGM